jgi:hypothetical protein
MCKNRDDGGCLRTDMQELEEIWRAEKESTVAAEQVM